MLRLVAGYVPKTMTHLYLIRHGEAVVNVQPIMGGMRGDVGLTPRGVAQAERLRDRLAATHEIKADVLIVSTLPRARQTAEIIAPALGVPMTFDDDVQELRIGEADGLSLKEAWDRFGVPDFRKYPFRPIAPGGENWGQFILRVGATLDRIAREHRGKTVVIVCHGGVIDGSFIYFFGINSLSLPEVELFTHNTSITHWEQHHLDGIARWRLRVYNDTTHLRDIGAVEGIRWTSFKPEPDTGTGRPSVPLPTEEQEE